MRTDNRGLTLVELLVSIAIASIVSIAIFSFMIVGARSFQKTSADVNVQHESQLVLNQLQDLLVDTNVGVEYNKDESTSDATLTLYNYDSGNPDKHVYEVVYQAAEKKLFYNEYSPLASGEGASRIVSKGSTIYQQQLLGENIASFTVDLSALEKKRVVRVDLEVERTQSKYKTSSNITLRNRIIIGNTIPEYLETTEVKDPLRVEGLANFYFEPGREVDLKSLGGYKVKMEDGTDYADQDIRFFLSDRAPVVSGTSISTNGRLLISKAQKQDFYVLVTSRTGKGAALEVKINMIIVDSVEIKLDSYTRRDGETGTVLSDYVFDAGDSFVLAAQVQGRNLDKAEAGVDMYGITWALGSGSEKYVTMGAATRNGNRSTCSFTMKNSFSLPGKQETDAFIITATSVRSTQIPYFTGTVKTPVVGTFTAFAHAKRADFTIKGSASLLRGKHDSSLNISLVNDLVNVIPGFDNTKHRIIAKVSVNELLYHQQEDAVSEEYTIRKDVADSGSVFQGEGVALGITPPSVTQSNPNIAYEYEVTFLVFEKRDTDSTNWGNLQVMGPGVTSLDGYHVADAKYRSNTIIQRCQRLFLYYNQIEKLKDENGNTIWNQWVGDYTAKVYPRYLKEHFDGSGWMNDSMDVYVNVYSCSNVEANAITNVMGTNGFRMYYQKDDSWVEFDESRRIKLGGDNYSKLAECIQATLQGNSLKVTYYPKKWVDEVPSMVRVVPCISYTENGEQKDGILFDSYAEVYLWNIEVPTVKDYQTGIPQRLLSNKKYCRLYFPSPLDADFTGLVKDQYKEWLYPYPPNVNGMESQIRDIKLSYKLSYNADGHGNKTWYLHLRYFDRDRYENLGVYTCKDTGQNWTMIEDSQVPDNLHFDR